MSRPRFSQLATGALLLGAALIVPASAVGQPTDPQDVTTAHALFDQRDKTFLKLKGKDKIIIKTVFSPLSPNEEHTGK